MIKGKSLEHNQSMVKPKFGFSTLHPLNKLAFTVILFTFAFLFSSPLHLTFMLGGMCLFLLILRIKEQNYKITFKSGLVRFFAPGSMGFFLLIFNLFTMPGNKMFEISFPFPFFDNYLALTATLEGMTFGLTIFLRIILLASILWFFCLITPKSELVGLFKHFRVPHEIIDILNFCTRYLTYLKDEIMKVKKAQKTRLGYINYKKGASSVINLVGTLIIRSFDQALKTDSALKVRGYKERMFYLPLPSYSINDLCYFIAILAGFFALFLLLQFTHILLSGLL